MRAVNFFKTILSFLKNPYVFIGLIIIFAIFLPGLTKKHELIERKEFLERESKKLYDENKSLLKETDRLKRDPYYQEKVIREKLGYIKEGEIILRLEPREKKVR
ncbi:MAG: septum formation initiator family protein [Candidatus Omnitrophica bacterium]|nr:septum formation initiator family protein [Candidatus Omnitrophota bacterium]